MNQVPEQVKTAGDVAAGFVAVGALAQILPPIAALVTIVYGCLRIYEWFEKRVNGRRGK